MNAVSELISRLGLPRIAAMGVVAVLLLGFFAFLIFRVTTPQMAPLYTGLSFEDSTAIVSELRGMNVPFELRGDGETILVPRDQITTIRMSLAENGLPSHGQVGYEIFDKQSTLGATSFVQNINQVRALEGELARTITSLSRIKSARVHLVLPERELFSQKKQAPSASIVVGVRGQLSSNEINAIQHLVASAIEGLTPDRVAIVDEAGQLLASGDGSDANSLVPGDAEERTLGVESRLRTRVEDLLANVVGPGRARVQVSAELNLSRSTTTSETFDPDGQVVRSSQSKETDNKSGPADNGAVSISEQLPNGSAANANGANQATQATTTEETTNYEISKTTQTKVDEAGGIKRLSVAVVVDGTYTQNQDGAATYTPRTPEQLQQLTALVRSAVGYDEARGDSVQVVNLQFAEPPRASAEGSSAPGLLDFTHNDLMSLANMAVTLLIALALLFFVLRPLLQRVLKPEDEPLALPQSAEMPAIPDGMVPDPENPNEWIDQARQSGAAQVETIKSVGTLVEENPAQATAIVRDWLTQAA